MAPPGMKSDDAGVLDAASLEVLSVDQYSMPQGPVLYEVTYTRGGWIWRTSHRYRDWLSLKDSLRAEFGTRNLPDEKAFPRKEDMGAIVCRLLTSCQGCRQGAASLGIVEERRQGLEAYFSQILAEHREIWDGSDDMKKFFFPGPPTSYSAALARRRSEQLKEDKSKTKEGSSTRSLMASSLKSTFGSIFEAATSPAATSSSSPRRFGDGVAPSSQGPMKTDLARTTPSAMNRFAAKLPSIRDLLFEGPPSSQKSSRQGTLSGSQHRPLTSASNKAPSESGVTDPDGISDSGDSKHFLGE